MRASRSLLGVILVAALHQGCRTGDTAPSRSEPDLCPAPYLGPAGSVHGIRADGRVDVTVSEAWPDRPPGLPPPTPQDVAQACAAFAACQDLSRITVIDSNSTNVAEYKERPLNADEIAGARARDLLWCTGGAFAPFAASPAPAEWAIPIVGSDGPEGAEDYDSNESWGFFIRNVLEAQGDCSRIRGVLTRRDASIECYEGGCLVTEKRTVRCNGDVAAFQETGKQRDCSRSEMHCSERSPTGCTDRPLVRCNAGGTDRCDGNVKLGCDSCGFVTFHDCSWDGGSCVETTDGAGCVPPASACVARSSSGGLTLSSCSGATLSLCVAGQPVDVSCEAIGLQACVSPASSTVVKSPLAYCPAK